MRETAERECVWVCVSQLGYTKVYMEFFEDASDSIVWYIGAEKLTFLRAGGFSTTAAGSMTEFVVCNSVHIWSSDLLWKTLFRSKHFVYVQLSDIARAGALLYWISTAIIWPKCNELLLDFEFYVISTSKVMRTVKCTSAVLLNISALGMPLVRSN